MVTALIALVLLLSAVCVVLLRAWQGAIRDLHSMTRTARRMGERAESYLSMLTAAGLVNSVTSCERTKGGAR